MSEIYPFGPTQTQDHLICPTLRRFNRTWEPTGPWAPHMMVGSAVHAGLAHLFMWPDQMGMAMVKANAVIDVDFQDNEIWTKPVLEALIVKGLTKCQATVKEILEREVLVATEQLIDGGRVDLVTRTDNYAEPYLKVTDHKVSLKKDPKYIQSNFDDNEISHQLIDYAWRVQNYYKQPVKEVSIHQVVLSPTVKSLTRTWPITSEAIEQYGDMVPQWWEQMTEHDEVQFNRLPMNLTQCINHKGYRGIKCPAFAACHSYYRDEQKMQVLYNKQTRTKEKA